MGVRQDYEEAMQRHRDAVAAICRTVEDLQARNEARKEQEISRGLEK